MRNSPPPSLANAPAARPPSPEVLAQLVGTRLRNARQTAGLSQEALASEMRARGFNWRQTTVTKAENAARPHLFVEIVALAEILGHDIERFYASTSVAAELVTAARTQVEEARKELEQIEEAAEYARHVLQRNACAYRAAIALRRYEESLDSGSLRKEIDSLLAIHGSRCLQVSHVFEGVGLPEGSLARMDAVSLQWAAQDELEAINTMSFEELQYESGEDLLALSKLANRGEGEREFLEVIREDPRWSEWFSTLLTDAVVQHFATRDDRYLRR